MVLPLCKNSLAAPQKAKELSDPGTQLLGIYYPREMKTLCPNKNLYNNTHNSIIHNSQKVETNHRYIKG